MGGGETQPTQSRLQESGFSPVHPDTTHEDACPSSVDEEYVITLNLGRAALPEEMDVDQAVSTQFKPKFILATLSHSTHCFDTQLALIQFKQVH